GLGPDIDPGAAEHAGPEATAGQGDAGDTQPRLGVDLGGDDTDTAGGFADLIRRDNGTLAGTDQAEFGLRHLGVQFQAAVTHDAEQFTPGRDDLAPRDVAADDKAGDGGLDRGLRQTR